MSQPLLLLRCGLSEADPQMAALGLLNVERVRFTHEIAGLAEAIGPRIESA